MITGSLVQTVEGSCSKCPHAVRLRAISAARLGIKAYKIHMSYSLNSLKGVI